MNSFPLTLCLPTLGKSPILAEVLESINAQSLKPNCLHILCQSDDLVDIKNIKNILSKLFFTFPVYLHIDSINRGLLIARAYLLRKVKSPFVMFAEDDLLLGNNYLSILASNMSQYSYACVSGKIIQDGESNLVSRVKHVLLYFTPLYDKRVFPSNKPFVSNFMCGSGTLWQTNLLKNLDLENYSEFHYLEDVVLSTLVSKATKNTFYIIPEALSYHHSSTNKRRFTNRVFIKRFEEELSFIELSLSNKLHIILSMTTVLLIRIADVLIRAPFPSKIVLIEGIVRSFYKYNIRSKKPRRSIIIDYSHVQMKTY